eukprot:m.11090 g.11090  ORF g.11090 m.11090 type:complete len:309 (+) comp22974_c0_seq1:739-1665(+)
MPRKLRFSLSRKKKSRSVRRAPSPSPPPPIVMTNRWHKTVDEQGLVTASKIISPPSPPSDSSTPFPSTTVLYSFVVNRDGLQCLYVRGIKAELDNIPQLKVQFPSPKDITIEKVDDFMAFLDTLQVCPGNCDAIFAQLCGKKEGVLRDKEKSVCASLDSYSPFLFQSVHYSDTVRTKACQLLVSSDYKRCPPCTSYRASLRTMASRSKKISSQSKFVCNAAMDTPALRAKLNTLTKDKRAHLQRIRRLEWKISQLTQQKDGTTPVSHSTQQKGGIPEISQLTQRKNMITLHFDLSQSRPCFVGQLAPV